MFESPLNSRAGFHIYLEVKNEGPVEEAFKLYIQCFVFTTLKLN